MALSLLSGLLQIDLTLLLLAFMAFITYVSNKGLSRKTGHLTFVRAFFNGLASHFFASLVLFFLLYVMLKFIFPEAVEEISNQMEAMLAEQGQMNDENKQALEYLASPLGFSLYMAFVYNLFAAAISLAMAFFKPKAQNNVRNTDQPETEE